VTYVVRFVNETWDYRLFYDNSAEFYEFESRIHANVSSRYVDFKYYDAWFTLIKWRWNI